MLPLSLRLLFAALLAGGLTFASTLDRSFFTAAAATAAAADVDTKNFAYGPATLTVAPGTTVVFKNSDTVAHTVTANDASFDSKAMDRDATWSHVFAKAGTYAYYCTYHTYMQGTVVVR